MQVQLHGIHSIGSTTRQRHHILLHRMPDNKCYIKGCNDANQYQQ